MAHHKRRRPKNRRAGCLFCKAHKANGAPHAQRQPVNAQRRMQGDECDVDAYDNDPVQIECDGEEIVEIVDHHYVEYGRAGITLVGLTTYRCEKCGGVSLSLPRLLDLHALIERSPKKCRLSFCEASRKWMVVP